jgi:hypothetical protein
MPQPTLAHLPKHLFRKPDFLADGTVCRVEVYFQPPFVGEFVGAMVGEECLDRGGVYLVFRVDRECREYKAVWTRDISRIVKLDEEN